MAFDFEDDDLAIGPRRRVRRFFAALGIRIAWLLGATVLALGSAGVVGATSHFPDLGGRPELTWAADQAMNARLDQSLQSLRALSTHVDSLGGMARTARAALTQRNKVNLDAAIRTGTAEVDEITSEAAAIGQALGCGDSQVVEKLQVENSDAVFVRYMSTCTAVRATQPLSDDWNTLTNGTVQAMAITDLLVDHDEVAAESTRLGSAGRYKEATSTLAGAYRDLDQVQPLYTLLAKTTDVSTLGTWLKRSRELDDALTQLWQALIASNGKVTAKVQDAANAVDQARSLLPYNADYLSVVLAEIAAAGINDAAISIETARGRLSKAVAALTPAP